MKIYLAGKIAHNDWRSTIVDGLDGWAETSATGATDGWPEDNPDWPVLKGAAHGHDYVGPYFASTAWTEWEDSHGVDATDIWGGHGLNSKSSGSVWYANTERYQEFILERCRRAIYRADVVFAWFEEQRPTCYGTLLELGMALAYGRRIVLAGYSTADFSGLWLAEAAARASGGCVVVEPGASALGAFLSACPRPRLDYYEYLQSPEWKARATAAKERAGGRCQVCNTTGRLDAHHRTYERLGDERDDDITVLCHACHKLYEQKRKAERATGATR